MACCGWICCWLLLIHAFVFTAMTPNKSIHFNKRQQQKRSLSEVSIKLTHSALREWDETVNCAGKHLQASIPFFVASAAPPVCSMFRHWSGIDSGGSFTRRKSANATPESPAKHAATYHGVIVSGRSRVARIPGAARHSPAVLLTSQPVRWQRRVLPRSDPNISPHSSGHARVREVLFFRIPGRSAENKSQHRWSFVLLLLSLLFLFCRRKIGIIGAPGQLSSAHSPLFCAGLSNYATVWYQRVLRGGAERGPNTQREESRSGDSRMIIDTVIIIYSF